VHAALWRIVARCINSPIGTIIRWIAGVCAKLLHDSALKASKRGLFSLVLAFLFIGMNEDLAFVFIHRSQLANFQCQFVVVLLSVVAFRQACCLGSFR
jgi:hypothetical protein